MISSQALKSSHKLPSANEASLNNMGKDNIFPKKRLKVK